MNYSHQLKLKEVHPRRGTLRPSKLIVMRDTPRRQRLRAFRGFGAYSHVSGIYSAATEEFRHPVGASVDKERDLSHQTHNLLTLRDETPDNSREN